MAEIKDWRGTIIEVGDVILYAVKHSTSVEVNQAVVREVGMKPKGVWTDELEPVVIADWQISSDYYSPVHKRGWYSNQRKIKRVKLTNFEGLTVVEKHTPPAFSARPELANWAEPKVV